MLVILETNHTNIWANASFGGEHDFPLYRRLSSEDWPKKNLRALKRFFSVSLRPFVRVRIRPMRVKIGHILIKRSKRVNESSNWMMNRRIACSKSSWMVPKWAATEHISPYPSGWKRSNGNREAVCGSEKSYISMWIIHFYGRGWGNVAVFYLCKTSSPANDMKGDIFFRLTGLEQIEESKWGR